MEVLFPGFRGIEDGLSVFVLAVSQVASIQNNQYVIVVHLGAAHRGPLQSPRKK